MMFSVTYNNLIIRYKDKLSQPQVRLFNADVGPEHFLVVDNARSHRAYVMLECSQTEDSLEYIRNFTHLTSAPLSIYGYYRTPYSSGS